MIAYSYTNLTANNNGGMGILVTNGSSMRFENTVDFSSSITANSNGLGPGVTFAAGLFFGTGGSGIIYSPISVDGNNGVGVGAWAGVLLVLAPGSITATNHNFPGFAGIGVGENGILRLTEVNLSGNFFGIWNRGSYFSVESGEISSVYYDIKLNLGARAAFTLDTALNLNSPNKIQCISTAFIFGPYACD